VQTSGTDTFPSLSTTTFGESHYYVLNFNDVFMSMGTLFTLLMVNNMDITSQGVEETTLGNYSRIFFVCWYTVGVLFTLNLFLAVLLNTLGAFLFSRQVKQMNQSSAPPASVPPAQSSRTAGAVADGANGEYVAMADGSGAAGTVVTQGLSRSLHPESGQALIPIDPDQHVMSQISMAAGQSFRSSMALQQSAAFFEDDLYHGLVVRRIEASSLAMHVPLSSSLSAMPGAQLMAVVDSVEGTDAARYTQSGRDVSESTVTTSSAAGSLLAVTLDNSSEHRASSLLSVDDRSSGSKSVAVDQGASGEIRGSSMGGRKSTTAAELSMHRIPAFLANGLASSRSSTGAYLQDVSYLNVCIDSYLCLVLFLTGSHWRHCLQSILNQQSQSISVAQHVASLLHSARSGIPHVNIISTTQYRYYALLRKVSNCFFFD
jgi:hypothetical protein